MLIDLLCNEVLKSVAYEGDEHFAEYCTDLGKYKTLTDFMRFGPRVSAYMHSGYSCALEIPIYGTVGTTSRESEAVEANMRLALIGFESSEQISPSKYIPRAYIHICNVYRLHTR